MSKSLRGATTSGNKGCCSSKSLKNLEATGVAGVGAQSLSQFISQSQTGDIIIDGGGGGGIGQIPDPLTVNNLIVLELAALENALIGTQLNIGNGDLVFQNNTITSNGSILVFPTIDFQIDPNLVVNGDYTRLNTTETRIFDRVPVIGFVDPGGILALDNHDRGLEFDYVTTDGMSFFFNRGFFGYDKDRDRFVAWKRAIIDGGAFGSDQNYMRTGAELNEFDLDVIYTTEIRNVDYLIGGSPNLNIRIMAASDIIFRSLLEDHLTADVEYVVTDEEIHTVGIGGASNTGRFRVEVANNPDCNRIELNDKVLVGVDPGVFIYHDELIEIKTCEAMSLIDIASADDMMITAENTLGIESLSGAITVDADSGIFERNRSGQFLVSSGTATTGGFTQIRGRKAATPLPGNFVPANGDVYIEATDEIFLDANDPITLFSGDYVKVVPILRVDEITSCNTTDPVTFDTDICITAGNALLTNEIHEKDSDLIISTTGAGNDINITAGGTGNINLTATGDDIVTTSLLLDLNGSTWTADFSTSTLTSTGDTVITNSGAAAPTGLGVDVYIGGDDGVIIRSGNAPPAIPAATDAESIFIGAEVQTVILAGSPTIPASFGVGSDLLVCAADNLILCADAASGILVESDLCVTAGNRILTDTINEKTMDLTIQTLGAGNDVNIVTSLGAANINLIAGGSGDINLVAVGDNVNVSSFLFNVNTNMTTMSSVTSTNIVAGSSLSMSGTVSAQMTSAGVVNIAAAGAGGVNVFATAGGADIVLTPDTIGGGGEVRIGNGTNRKLFARSGSNDVAASHFIFGPGAGTAYILDTGITPSDGRVIWYNAPPGHFTLTNAPSAGDFLQFIGGSVTWSGVPAASLQDTYDASPDGIIDLSGGIGGIMINDIADFTSGSTVGVLFEVSELGGLQDYLQVQKLGASNVEVNVGDSSPITEVNFNVFGGDISLRATDTSSANRALVTITAGGPTVSYNATATSNIVVYTDVTGAGMLSLNAGCDSNIILAAGESSGTKTIRSNCFDNVMLLAGIASTSIPSAGGTQIDNSVIMFAGNSPPNLTFTGGNTLDGQIYMGSENNVYMLAGGTNSSLSGTGTIDDTIMFLAQSTITMNAMTACLANVIVSAQTNIAFATAGTAEGNVIICAGGDNSSPGVTISTNIDDSVVITAGEVSPPASLPFESIYMGVDQGTIILDAAKTTVTGLLDPTGLILDDGTNSGTILGTQTLSNQGMLWTRSSDGVLLYSRPVASIVSDVVVAGAGPLVKTTTSTLNMTTAYDFILHTAGNTTYNLPDYNANLAGLKYFIKNNGAGTITLAVAIGSITGGNTIAAGRLAVAINDPSGGGWVIL